MRSVIVVAGEALVDLVVQPDGAVTSALGGAPFNTARAVARLGRPVEFAGVISEDRFGTLLRAQLVADGVGVAGAPSTDLPTTLAAAELDPGGAAQYRFYIDGTSSPALTPDHLRALPPAPDIVFTGGLGLVLEPMAETLAGLVDSVASSTIVVVDVNCRPRVVPDRDRYVARVERVLGRADLVKVSDEDLTYLRPGVDEPTAAAELVQLGPSAVVVTGGSAPTRLFTPGSVREIAVDPPPGPLVDTIGAGDTFGAALMTAWLDGGGRRAGLRAGTAPDELARAVRAANQVAAIVVTRRGADPPWRAELPATWPSAT